VLYKGFEVTGKSFSDTHKNLLLGLSDDELLKFVKTEGWIVEPGTLESIVTRAPTQEPYPYHAKGVNNKNNFNE
jgi:hypothetical protein